MRGTGDAVWVLALGIVISLFVFPASSAILFALTERHPYLMGFAKFFILASMGDLLAIRIAEKSWRLPTGLFPKALAWGVVGLLVVLMFSLFSLGVAAAADRGLLPVGTGGLQTFMLAFWTSALMNLSFGPVFMAAHRVSDAYIESRGQGGRPRLADALDLVDWKRFILLILGRTIPLFWIPAHTVAFLLPPRYRVLMAALLSIALGVILSWTKERRAMPGEEAPTVRREDKRL